MESISGPSIGYLDGRYVLDDDRWLVPPADSFYDPTGGLPADPDVGDRYISDATAGGWTIDYVYEWDGTEWVESTPEEGWMIWMLFELVFYVFFSGGWMEIGDTSYLRLDCSNDPLTGGLLLAAGTTTLQPIRFQAGVALTTPVAGVMEYNNGRICITNVSTCKAIDRTDDVVIETTTVADEADETTIWTGSMAANSLVAGNVFKFHADGAISNAGNHADNDITIRVKVGGNEVITLTPSTKALDNVAWHLNANATQRTIGSTGSRAFHMHLVVGDVDEKVAIGVAEINTTANMDVTVTVDWVTADAANTISLYQGFMEYKN